MTNQEEKLNITITLRQEHFLDCNGIFPEVHGGCLTKIVDKFQNKSSNDILQLVIQRDELGRTPLDIAWYVIYSSNAYSLLGYKNIVLYLMTNLGTPSDVIHRELNVDNEGRHLYHYLLYKGNYECLISILNIERVYLKKTLFDQLYRDKQKYRFKNMDIKHGHLVSTVFHDAETVKRHEEFNIRVQNLLEQYARDLINRYREILFQQDKFKRNPAHYGAMSKYTKCFKCLEALLNIEIDQVEGYDSFLSLFFELQLLETSEDRKFDPRKYQGILAEFKHLLSPHDYNSIVKDFNFQIKLLLKEALDRQDDNHHSPLHVASYFGDFKASRYMIRLGADPNSAAFSERPLEVGKDQFTRSVLQNLNDAAFQCNVKDIKYLVNCGNKIDNKISIFGEAPIHKAVLTKDASKQQTLKAIIENKANVNNMDSNGWTALHHAAYTGDIDSAQILIQSGADVNCYSNQQKTPLHFAAMNNHGDIIKLLLGNQAQIEWMDDLKCTPLHLACKKGNIESVAILLASGAHIYALDFRQWTPLHYAAYNGHRKVCNYLLKWEADKDVLIDMKNSQNKKAINIAKNPETKKGFTHIWRACRDGELDQVRIILREGQDINEQTQSLKNSPLHIAAKNGHFLIVKYLLENGADPNLQNREGRVPFEFAAEAKRNLDVGAAVVKKAGLNPQKVDEQRKIYNAIENILQNRNAE